MHLNIYLEVTMDTAAGLLTNYMQISPHELENGLSTISFIQKEGIGRIYFDKVAELKFGDKEEEYIQKLHKAIRNEPKNIKYLSEALIEWYNSWYQTFRKFDVTTAKNYFHERPLHTWLYCLMNGKNEIFQNLAGEELIVLRRSRYEELTAKEKKKPEFVLNSNKHIDQKTDFLDKMEALYQKDRDVRMKVLLMDKKMAIFHESNWDWNTLENLKNEYHFEMIDQYPAIDKPKSIGEYDYYVLVTSRASHSTKNVLESKISKEKIIFVSADNTDRVMEQLKFQLEGNLQNDE